jgi:hypothetical protein
MATQKIVSSNAFREDGGTAMYGGNIPAGGAGVITNAPGKSIAGAGPSIETLPKDAVTGFDKILSGGTFAQITAGQYIIAKKTSSIAGGQSNSLLVKMAADKRIPKINKIESMTAYKFAEQIRSGNYNIFSGTYRLGAASGQELYTAGGSGDKAASPTMAIPGRITYNYGKKRATTSSYNAKTTGP